MDLDKLHLKKTGKKSDGKRFGFIKVFTKRIDISKISITLSLLANLVSTENF